MRNKPHIEVCFSPDLFHLFPNKDAIVVITDVLRATTAICAAFENGAASIIPVAGLDEAREYKQKGYLVAAERDGFVQDFADFGNSPYNFTPQQVGGKTVVYTTTNGTRAVHLASGYRQILIGAFINLQAVCSHLLSQDADVIVLCAGWKGKFNLEDTLFAGALASRLMGSGHYLTICDSTYAALDLWSAAKSDLLAYIRKAAQFERLRSKGLDDVIPYCLTLDISTALPVFHDYSLFDLQKMNEKHAKIGNSTYSFI
jgi:2-phosphosulfolactate phosphatase